MDASAAPSIKRTTIKPVKFWHPAIPPMQKAQATLNWSAGNKGKSNKRAKQMQRDTYRVTERYLPTGNRTKNQGANQVKEKYPKKKILLAQEY